MSCVIKLGGSLLQRSGWYAAFEAFVQTLKPQPIYLIVGGGMMIQAMRVLDDRHKLDSAAMHWRCVEMLRYTSDIAYQLLMRTSLSTRLMRIDDAESFGDHQDKSLDNISDTTIFVVNPISFYNPQLAANPDWSLPTLDWRTTTDAIAILLATLVKAEQCVLLKSCDVDSVQSLKHASELGIVDSESLRMAKHFANIRLLELRVAGNHPKPK